MKRLLCGTVIALSVLAVSAVAASSAGANIANSYRVSYIDPGFGATECSGVHVASKKFPGTDTSGGKDVFFCSIERHLRPGTTYTQANFAWCSDYFMQPEVLGECVLADKFAITVGASGLSIIGWAVYP